MKSWKKTILINNKTVMDAINSLNKSLMKIVIVIDKKKTFCRNNNRWRYKKIHIKE